MSRLAFCAMGVVLGLWLTKCAAGAEPMEIKGWGTPVDPDGDCEIRSDEGKLAIRIPGGKVHDLWAGRQNENVRFNAPRVWQEVEGDFLAQVKVTSAWELGGVGTATNAHYNGAGLSLWDSEQQYLRNERNLMNHVKSGPICYASPVYDKGGKRMYEVKVGKRDFFKGRSTWLRVERTGQEVATSISHDGTNWTSTGILTTEFPERIQVGVHSISTSDREFKVEFEDFRLYKK